ncbi:hypothetical protein [Nitratireductor sp. ZSWI3]|uniref:hypothetical protein n=1 Tax=Nitratireductor sp. ZSWI3 TaxID=2966359 RepID=UPI00215017D9|nr:hypothetical protein [Nitratireductor sp. ZSWI3]MCR4265800.1 hypothetical protein [Nitratireductor sp. ZSWI3]
MNSHNKLIGEIASKILTPLGFRRKGRSRTWLWDHGWWVTVVAFQPSAWARGAGLDVAAHWLWTDQPNLSFDHFQHSETFVEYVSDAQFLPEATRLVRTAADEAFRLQQTFPTIEAAATVLSDAERKLPQHARGGWGAYDAAMAMGLSGHTSGAALLFQSVRDERVLPSVSRVEKLLSDPARFRQAATELICMHRNVIGLTPEPTNLPDEQAD